MNKQIIILPSLLFCFYASAQRLSRPTKDTAKITPSELRSLVDEGLEPRKYVTVIYKKRPDTKTENSLAVWHWDPYVQHQKYKVLDKDGVIEIYFDKDKLAKDIKFKGSFSLEAIVKSKGGDRKIEVSPYSLIGEQAKDYGPNSISPELTAQLLFNAIYTIKSTLHGDNESIYYFESFVKIKIDTLDIDRIVGEISKRKLETVKIKDSALESKNILFQILNLFPSSYYYPDDLRILSNRIKEEIFDSIGIYNYRQLNDDLLKLRRETILYNKIRKNESLQKAYNNISNLIRQLKRIIDYMNAFEMAGEDAKSIFLRLIGKDILQYNDIKNLIKINFDNLSQIFSNEEIAKNNIDEGKITPITEATKKALYEFSSIRGSEFYKIITDSVKLVSNLNAVEDSMSLIEFNSLQQLKISGSYKPVLDKLSKIAGEYIYGLLTFGIIDLAKNDVKEGDKLYLSVKWKNRGDFMQDSLRRKDEVSLPIGIFNIEQTGWSTNVSESFYLIERIKEPLGTADPNLSPSNFKGAAGVSLMRTYNYAEPEDGDNKRFLNWLQPSIGINLSYIDFYTTKDLELGLGFQLGIFKNSIYLGYGVNLNGIRKGERNASYFMLGLSFVNIAQKVKSLSDPN
ncbi:MAG: hypothetical protein WDN26_17935 [Chitinophagaceae bacterium]